MVNDVQTFASSAKWQFTKTSANGNCSKPFLFWLTFRWSISSPKINWTFNTIQIYRKSSRPLMQLHFLPELHHLPGSLLYRSEPSTLCTLTVVYGYKSNLRSAATLCWAASMSDRLTYCNYYMPEGNKNKYIQPKGRCFFVVVNDT